MDYVLPFNLTKESIKRFSDLIDVEYNEGIIPSFLLPSLSAPALLGVGEKYNTVGLHLKQTYEQHNFAGCGPLEVGVCMSKSRSCLAIFENYWIQNGKLLASGKSMVRPATIHKPNSHKS